MKARQFLIITISLSLLHLISCSKDETVQQATEETLVVDGWIESGKNPMVFITTAVPAVEEPQSAYSLVDHIIRYAKVSIEHNGVEYPLVSSISDYYYLMAYFTTSDIVGEVGGVYSLKIEYKDKVALSTTTIPNPAELDSLWWEPMEEHQKYRVIFASFHDNPETQDFYRFFIWIRNRQNYYSPAYLGLIDDSSAGEVLTMQVDSGNQLPEFMPDGRYYSGDIVSVKFATTTEEVYRFWSKVDQNNMVGFLPFNISGVNVYGNVEGALGCWAGYGINEYTICVN